MPQRWLPVGCRRARTCGRRCAASLHQMGRSFWPEYGCLGIAVLLSCRMSRPLYIWAQACSITALLGQGSGHGAGCSKGRCLRSAMALGGVRLPMRLHTWAQMQSVTPSGASCYCLPLEGRCFPGYSSQSSPVDARGRPPPPRQALSLLYQGPIPTLVFCGLHFQPVAAQVLLSLVLYVLAPPLHAAAAAASPAVHSLMMITTAAATGVLFAPLPRAAQGAHLGLLGFGVLVTPAALVGLRAAQARISGPWDEAELRQGVTGFKVGQPRLPCMTI